MIGIDPRGVARRAPGGPLEGWPGADAGPAAPRSLDFIYGWIRQWIRSGPSELPSREADGLTGRSPTPYHIVVPACRSGGQGGARPPGASAEFAGSPRRDERCGQAVQNWTI